MRGFLGRRAECIRRIFADLFVAIILFPLVGGYVLTALILAPFGRTIHLKIVGVFMVLLAADYFYSEGKNWIRGADFRQSFENATVYASDRGLIEFERTRRNRLVETSFGAESGLHKIGFEVEGSLAPIATERGATEPARHHPDQMDSQRSTKGAGAAVVRTAVRAEIVCLSRSKVPTRRYSYGAAQSMNDIQALMRQSSASCSSTIATMS